MDDFSAKKQHLQQALASQQGKLRLRKRTISNLFRYGSWKSNRSEGLSLADFNNVLAVDVENNVLDVEGLATFESIVDAVLPLGRLPLVTPELKHITIGGATVGIGIESSCYRHGFVHDGLIEAEVLLPDGRIVQCNSTNAYSDLFHALPNSYGTLGYILRAKIRLMKARPFVHMKVARFANVNEYLNAMQQATEDNQIDFIEGLFFSNTSFYLMTARMVEGVPYTHDIVREHIFYKLIQQTDDIYLTTRDYIFRYDPDWFWNVPDTFAYRLFRRYAPGRFRNSGFYTRYCQWKEIWQRRLPWRSGKETEPLIQDWEVPWEQARELIDYALDNVDLEGKPWTAVPIKTPASPTIYPIKANELYFNLGCYCNVSKAPGREGNHYTRILDQKCFDLSGIKMLYSSSFISREEFDRLYNGPGYEQLKTKYDPEQKAYTLYEKAVSHSNIN